MLGSLNEADDAVQEVWLRLSRSDTSNVENLSGWLTTVVSRVCLDMLRSRASRREDPLDVQTSDPVVHHAGESNPKQEALLAESVGLALLVVLETLDPAERLALVLHDMFDLPFDEIPKIVGRSQPRRDNSRAEPVDEFEASRPVPVQSSPISGRLWRRPRRLAYRRLGSAPRSAGPERRASSRCRRPAWRLKGNPWCATGGESGPRRCAACPVNARGTRAYKWKCRNCGDVATTSDCRGSLHHQGRQDRRDRLHERSRTASPIGSGGPQ